MHYRKKAEKDYLDVTGVAVGVQLISRDQTALCVTISKHVLYELGWHIGFDRFTVEFLNRNMIVRRATDEDHFSKKRSKKLCKASNGAGRIRFSKFPEWIAAGKNHSRHAVWRMSKYKELEISVPDEITTTGPELFKKPQVAVIHSSPKEPGDNTVDLTSVVPLTDGNKSNVTFTPEQFEAALDAGVRVALRVVREGAA